MGVFTYERENTSSVPPAKLYKALVHDADSIIPKLVEPIQSIELVEGTGGPGSVKKFTFLDGGATKHVLHKVEGIDEANFGYDYSIVGGDALPEAFEKISFKNKLVAAADGGSVAKTTVTYFTKGGAPPSDEEIKAGQAKGDGVFKVVEGYVLANPDLY